MPTAPKAKDSGNLSGHSAGSFLNPFPSEMECDVQPNKATTTVPVGKAGFLLSTTLEDERDSKTGDVFSRSWGSGCFVGSVQQRALS